MEITDLVWIDATGYHYADYPSFLAWRQEQYRAIYGADVYLEADSQDGQLLAIQAKADYDTATRGAAVYASFAPITAQGTGLSRVVKINGLNRLVPSFSTVTLTIVGTAGTIIANGVATDSLQQKWVLPLSVTIPDAGTIDVIATAAVVGAVFADPSTVTTIFTPTRGWQTVDNVFAATPGSPVESDANLRIRQTHSTAIPSLTVFDGTVGAVQNLPGVTKARGYENDTGTTDGNGIPAHTICVVAAGGVTTDICQAIQVHKTPGTGTFGNTSATVYDAHGMPLLIKYQTATAASIKVRVTLAAGQGWSNDFVALIQTSVSEVINSGLIGDAVLITKTYAPAYLFGSAAGQTYDIATVELRKNAGSFVTTNITLNFDENPVCSPSDVTVVVT